MHYRYRHTTLLICTAAFFVTMVGRLVISPVVPAIITEFDVSNTTVGIALSGMWLAYSLTQFPSGLLANRYDERLVILVAVCGTAGASLLLASAPLFAVFLFATVALGAAAGLHYTVATALLERSYDDVGTAVGIHTAGAPVAGLTAPVASAWVGTRFGWRPAVSLTVLVAVPVVVAFVWQLRTTGESRSYDRTRERTGLGPLLEVLARRPVAFTVLIAVVSTFVWQGVASFLPLFLVTHHGQHATTAGAFFSLYFVIQGVGQIAVGALSDRYGRDIAIAGCMVAGIGGFVLLVVGAGPAAVVAGVLFVGIGMSYGAALIPRFLDNFSGAESGAGLGLVRMIYGSVGATGSITVGFLADRFDWVVSFSVLVVLLLFVLGALSLNAALDLDC